MDNAESVNGEQDSRGLSDIVGYEFKSSEYVTLALSHSSIVNERKLGAVNSNERLEFLGDAVLELVVSSYLYAKYPELLEGELTKLRASVVCEPMLAKRAKALGLGNTLRMSRGDESMGGRERDSTLSDLFEAVIGAIYLDGGLDEARRFILRELEREIDFMRSRFNQADPKTALQEVLQRNGPVLIEYAVVSAVGPEHEKTFEVTVAFERRILGRGKGRSKKEAEQNAAAAALTQLGEA